VAQVLASAIERLAAAGCDTARLDAEVLLAHILGRDRSWLYAHPGRPLSSHQLNACQSLVSRRVDREPVAYLVGHKEFFDLDFFVTRDVLIPRPETEHLVEWALQWASSAKPGPLSVADVGTGSGAIAVTLAAHVPRAHIFATDTSRPALAVARDNAVRHGVASRVSCVMGDLLAPLAGPFHLIAANPPYLSHADLASTPPEVARWEPRPALDGGPDGLEAIRRLLAMAATRLCAGGLLLVEIGAGQGLDVLALAGRYFEQATFEIARDYAGLDRLLVVRLF